VKPFRIVVTVQPHESGGASSVHEFASPEDEAVARALPNEGASHIAHGLLLEALRRETYLVSLVHLTKDPGYLGAYFGAAPEERRSIEAELAAKVAQILEVGAEKLVPGVARGVLEMHERSAGGPTSGHS
jgi:hypothetical protein